MKITRRSIAKVGVVVLCLWLQMLWIAPCYARLVNIQNNLHQSKQGLLLELDGMLYWSVGNSEYLVVNTNALMRLHIKSHIVQITGEATYGREKDKAFVSQGAGSLRYRFNFLPFLRAEAFGHLEVNEFKKIETLVYGGLGLVGTWRPLPQLSLQLATGYMLEYNKYSKGYLYLSGKEEKLFHRWANYFQLSWKLSNILRFESMTMMYPALDNFADWRLEVDNMLKVKVHKWFYLTVTHSQTYWSIPPVGSTTLKQYDSSLLVGVKGSFLLWNPSTKKK